MGVGVDESGSQEELQWQDREPQEKRLGKEALRERHWQVDRGSFEGTQGLGREGIRRDQEGLCVVQEGQGVLRQVKESEVLRDATSSPRTSSVVRHDFLSGAPQAVVVGHTLCVIRVALLHAWYG